MTSPLPAVLEVPLLPLSGIVLFPGSVLPLRVFEPRYIQLLNDVMSADKLIGMAHAKPHSDVSDPDAAVHPVLGLGQVVANNAMPDGTFHIALLGKGRCRIETEITHEPYRRARVVTLHDRLPALSDDVAALKTETAELLQAAHALVARTVDSQASNHVKRMLKNCAEPGTVTDLLAGIYVHDSTMKQTLLEYDDVLARVRLLRVILDKLLERQEPIPAPQDYTHRTICLN